MTWLSLLITVLVAAVFLAVLEEGLWEKGAWKPSSGFLELLGWLVVLDLLWPMGWGKEIELVLEVPEEWLAGYPRGFAGVHGAKAGFVVSEDSCVCRLAHPNAHGDRMEKGDLFAGRETVEREFDFGA